MSVADNAGDSVFLHVPASSERQESGNKTGLKKRKKHLILKHSDVHVAFLFLDLFHTAPGYNFTFTSYFMSKYHIKTQTEHLVQINLYARHTKMYVLEYIKHYFSA